MWAWSWGEGRKIKSKHEWLSLQRESRAWLSIHYCWNSWGLENISTLKLLEKEQQKSNSIDWPWINLMIKRGRFMVEKNYLFYMKFGLFLSVLHKAYLWEGSRGALSSTEPCATALNQDRRPCSARNVGTLSATVSPTLAVLYRDTAWNKWTCRIVVHIIYIAQ